MRPEAKVIEDIKKNYKEGVKELSLYQFTTMLQKLKTEKEEYGGFTGYNYYLILGPGNHHDIFIEGFFKSLQNS